MHKNITLNEVRNSAFLANQSYETFDLSKKDAKPVKNPATNSSFEVVEQKNEYTAFEKGFGFSATVFRNINTIMQKCML